MGTEHSEKMEFIMNYVQDLVSNKVMFFTFMKEKYKVFENSNIFFRDIQYAIKSYFEKKEHKISYQQAEIIASEFIKSLENEGHLKKMSSNAWKVNFSLGSNVTEITVDNVQQN